MFSEVRQAILPLALRKIQRRGDLERAGLLIESLAKHWRDTKPFELLIVSPRHRRASVADQPAALSQHRRVGAARERFLSAVQRLLPDDRLVPAADRQAAGAGDAGLRRLPDAQLRRLLRRRLRCHDLRRRTAGGCRAGSPSTTTNGGATSPTIVGTPYDAKGHGLSVTPNLLHGDLAGAGARPHAQGAWVDDPGLAHVWKLRRPVRVPWTEYSLYTSVAELQGQPVRLSRRMEHLLRRRRAPVLRAVPASGAPTISSGWSSCPTAAIPAASSSSSRATPASRWSASASTA